MSVSKIKTIVISALVLINVFFLAVIVIDTVADVHSERQAIENACAVLNNGGISIDPDNVKIHGALRALRTVRGDDAESVIARAILGPTDITDQGVIYRYENAERGAAEFYSAGDFEITLNDGAVTNAEGAVKTVQKLLRGMKIEISEITVSGASGSETVTATGAFRGVSIFNCTIEFVFKGESLETIKGRSVTGIAATDDGAVISSAGTALLGFLAWSCRNDVGCGHIYSVESGYQYRVSGSFGEGVIAPAWLIVSDKGRYIIDDASGEVWPY